jgi:hypothetical protein
MLQTRGDHVLGENARQESPLTEMHFKSEKNAATSTYSLIF